VAFVLCTAAVARGAIEEPEGIQTTPPRLAFVEGDVLFWRPGAGDWEAAQQNIPLAAGDSLATRSGKVELQIGGKSFIRAADDTQLRMQSNEPDFLQLEVNAGHVTIDVRELRRGTSLRIDTPNAVVAVARDGYYRVDVDAETTRVIVRRGGQATVTPSGGSAADVATGEAVEVSGKNAALAALAAPPFDDWDRWNYDRVDRFLAAPRSYSVSSDVYGADDLEQYGSWRYANTYGRVWVPNSVPAGWAPYTDGRWIWDPLYGYSWVDYAPWGWAPYHYGRWVYSGYWGWAPGPVLGVPVYSPALVAFFGAPGFSVGFGFGAPVVSWVALGWGEPLFPWWGPVGFIGAPCWRGWGGPRVVNNIVINNNTVVNANKVNFYRNVNAPGGIVGVPKDQFNSRSIDRVRVTNFNKADLQPLHGALPVASRTGALGKVPMPDVAGHKPFGGTPQQGAAGANFGRTGQGAASPSNFGRQGEQALGAQRPSASVAGAKAGGTTAMLDALRARGPGALTAPPRPDSNQAAAPSRSSDFGRGQSPPPLPGAAKNSAVGSAFDALRRGGSAAPSGNAGRPSAPLASTAPTDLRRNQPPALPNGYGKPGSSTAPVGVQSAPAPRQFERRADVPAGRPAAPAWSRSVGKPTMPTTMPMRAYRAPNVSGGGMAVPRGGPSSAFGGARGAPLASVQRGGGGAMSNFGRASGGGHGGGKLGR